MRGLRIKAVEGKSKECIVNGVLNVAWAPNASGNARVARWFRESYYSSHGIPEGTVTLRTLITTNGCVL